MAIRPHGNTKPTDEHDEHNAAVVRARRARERMIRAIERQRQAELEAEAADDQRVSRLRLGEAAAHRRAAELHERAALTQARHAEAHE
ncbi:MAG: hypothetical protein JO039_03610 [Solirubrobacterales bacterium]|nr:hypothetical protein [Solirubrobacterales bacterium]